MKDPVNGNLGTYRQVLWINMALVGICLALVAWTVVQTGKARVVPILWLLFMLAILIPALRALLRHPNRPTGRKPS